MRAYCARPRSSSCASNVPMQPRSRFSLSGVPFGRAIVFHVTKSGVAVCACLGADTRLVRLLLLLVAELAELGPLGVDEVLCTLEELVLAGEGARRRDMAAGRWGAFAERGSSVEASSAVASLESSSSFAALGSDVYFAQRSSTCWRVRALRFSSSADSVSKQ